MKAKYYACERIIKLCVLFIYAVLAATWYSRFHVTYLYIAKTSPFDFWLKGYFLLFLFKFLVVRPLYFIPHFYTEFFKKGLFLGKDIFVDCRLSYPLGSLFKEIVSLAWICKKMNINLKVDRSTNMIWQCFENDIVNITDKANKSLDFSHNFFLD